MPHSPQPDQTEHQPCTTTTPSSKLPKFQVFIIAFLRLTEPISFSVIFPIVTFMVAEYKPDLPTDQVGYYCGLIESIFSICQFLTVILWGKLSDRIGRKPVILIGLVGVSLSTLSFGFSRSVLSMVFARAIGGALNGNAAVIKSMLGEITTPENQARAFSLLPTFFAVGSIIGPLLGGFLNRPAERFPNSWFAKSVFWQDHPWLLPCLVAATAPILGFIMAVKWLKETLPSSHKKRFFSPGERQPLIQPDDTDQDRHDRHPVLPPIKPPTRVLDLLKDSNLVTILISYSILCFQTISLDAVFVLFAYTPIQSGGLGFSSQDIGLALSFSGGLIILVQLFLFPFFQNRLGTARLYKLCMFSYPIIFILFPIVNYIARVSEKKQGEGAGNEGMAGVWAGIWAISILKTCANMVFSCSMLLVNAAAPSRDVLATINGMAQSCASFVRAIGPMIASSLYALSIGKFSGSFNGNSVFVFFSFVSVLGFLKSLHIQDEDQTWRTT